MVVRADPSFVEQGIDIRQWDADYKDAKAKWDTESKVIIENACKSGVLPRNKKEKFIALDQSKENFLISLDRRHFGALSEKEREDLGTKIVELFMTEIRNLPAVRFSSLCFWYAYIDDRGYRMSRKGSDIGDFYQMSLIPYCSAFTVDNAMFRLLSRVLSDLKCQSAIYNREEFDKVLSQE